MGRRIALGAASAALAIALAVGSAGAAKGPTVKAVDYEFDPKKIEADANEKVTWKGKEGKHSVTVIDTDIDKVLKEGEKVKIAFKEEGLYKYYCRFHEDFNMKGKVEVGL